MSRTRWRISRGLVALLLVGSVIGLMWWLRANPRILSAGAPMLAAPAGAQASAPPNPQSSASLDQPAPPVATPATITQVGQTVAAAAAPAAQALPSAPMPSSAGTAKGSPPLVQPNTPALKNTPSSPPAAVAQMVNSSIQSSSTMAMRYATTVTPTSAAPTTGPTMGPTTRSSRMLSSPIVPFPLPAPAPVLTLNIAAASGPPGILAEAGAKAQSGELLAARKMLNDALVSGKLDPATAAAARAQIAELNQTIVFSTQKFPGDEYGGVYAVRPGDMMRRIAEQYAITWELLCRLNGMSDPRHLRSDSTLKVLQGPFSAVVSKRTFTLDLYLGSTPGSPGSMYVCTFPVGLGREDSTTPTGTWMCEIHRKLKEPTYYSPRGEGVIQSGDPRNPLGHRWIGLTGIDGQAVGQQSYGIHGTIDDSSIGKTASLGCIRMHNADVELVFDLLVEGKSVVVVKD